MPEMTMNPKDAKILILRNRITQMLKVMGSPAECRSGCKGQMYWCRTKTGKMILYEVSGEAHFANCPEAEGYRGTGRR